MGGEGSLKEWDRETGETLFLRDARWDHCTLQENKTQNIQCVLHTTLFWSIPNPEQELAGEAKWGGTALGKPRSKTGTILVKKRLGNTICREELYIYKENS